MAFRYLENTGDCVQGSVPGDGCYGIIYAWGMGALPLELPKDVGYAVGKDVTDWTHYVIQIHYNNVDLKPGMIDNSGLRVTYSPVRRPIQAGVLLLGDPATTGSPLAKGQSGIPVQNSCPSNCTSGWSSAITVFAEFPHMHTIGSRILTNQYRDG